MNFLPIKEIRYFLEDGKKSKKPRNLSRLDNDANSGKEEKNPFVLEKPPEEENTYED